MIKRTLIKLRTNATQWYFQNFNFKGKAQFAHGAKVSKESRFEGANYIGENANISNSSIGYASYLARNSSFQYSEIGRYCSIGFNSCVIYGTHPSKDYISTHPAFYNSENRFGPQLVDVSTFDEIKFVPNTNLCAKIGNDVWIGADVKILSGISIGDGAIVCTGALVTRDVPPYAVVGGVPAKIIRYRFSEQQIGKLLKLKWWDKDIEFLRKMAPYFADVDKFCQRGGRIICLKIKYLL